MSLNHLLKYGSYILYNQIKTSCSNSRTYKKESIEEVLSKNGFVEICVNGRTYNANKIKAEKVLNILSYDAENKSVEITVNGELYETSKSKSKKILKIL